MSTRSSELRVDGSSLKSWSRAALLAAGVSQPQAESVADAVLESDLRGIHTHGVEMLPRYVRGYLQGFLNPLAEPHRVGGRGAVARWDGDNGLGHYACDLAVDALAVMAREHGVGVVAVRNSNHFGMAARYAMKLASRRLIGFVTTSTPPVMPALDSAKVVIGNNPLAWAIPRRQGNPIVLDMAVSAVARGKIRLAASAGKAIPLGWAVDRDGEPTTDAGAALDGSLLPVGGAKGYGLAVVHELLSGALSGARMMTEISTRTITVGDLHDSWGIGHLFLAIDPDASVGLEEFFDRVEMAAAVLTQQVTRSGQPVLLPGAPEFEWARRNAESGIALPAHVVGTLDEIADQLGIARLAPPDSIRKRAVRGRAKRPRARL